MLFGLFPVIFVWVFVIFINCSSFFAFNAVIHDGFCVAYLGFVNHVQLLAVISLLFIIRLILLWFYSLWDLNDFHYPNMLVIYIIIGLKINRIYTNDPIFIFGLKLTCIKELLITYKFKKSDNESIRFKI